MTGQPHWFGLRLEDGGGKITCEPENTETQGAYTLPLPSVCSVLITPSWFDHAALP